MKEDEAELNPRLEEARQEAWDMLPLWRQGAIRLVWRRQGCTPLWITVAGNASIPGKPAFDIMGGFVFYSLKAEVAASAPRLVLVAMYGCMLVHTSRFWYRSHGAMFANGHEDIHLRPSWPKTIRLAASYGLAIDRMERWTEYDEKGTGLLDDRPESRD